MDERCPGSGQSVMIRDRDRITIPCSACRQDIEFIRTPGQEGQPVEFVILSEHQRPRATESGPA